MRDLGTETIVMQTRIGLDGDVITRIERDFAESGGDPIHGKAAEATKNAIIGLHEKHIDISVKYWNSLVNMVKDFVSFIIFPISLKVCFAIFVRLDASKFQFIGIEIRIK